MEIKTKIRAARPLFITWCLAAGLAAACSVQGAGEAETAASYSLNVVVLGPGGVEGLPSSAAGGAEVAFRTQKTRGADETVSASLTTGGSTPVSLGRKPDGSFSFAMPKRNTTVTVEFSLAFPYDDAALGAGETLYIKTATDTSFLLSKDDADWTDAPEGYLESDVVSFDALTGDRVVVVTTEAGLTPVSPVRLRFANANLTPSRSLNGSPLSIKDGAAALVTMVGANTFAPGTHGSAGILVTPGSALTLTGPAGSSFTAKGRSTNFATGSAGIGGSNKAGYPEGGDITIVGDITVTANGGYNAPGIGAGAGHYGGTLTIGGNAVVTGSGGTEAPGIGGGWGGGGGVIVIKDNATVIGKGSAFYPGIGGDQSDGESTDITILGNARVYGQAAGPDAAGIGSSDGDTTLLSGAKITIGDGTDNPLVIARGSSASDNGGAASGLGGGGSTRASKVYIEIKSGTVIAQSNRNGGAAIGAQVPSADSYVKITGGAVYAVNPASSANDRLTRPAAVGADGATAVYPLYAGAPSGGPIRVPAAGGGYTAPVFDRRVTDFLAVCGLDPSAVFPGLASLASELWVPAGAHAGIKAGTASKTATVNASYPDYSAGMGSNVLQ